MDNLFSKFNINRIITVILLLAILLVSLNLVSAENPNSNNINSNILLNTQDNVVINDNDINLASNLNNNLDSNHNLDSNSLASNNSLDSNHNLDSNSLAFNNSLDSNHNLDPNSLASNNSLDSNDEFLSSNNNLDLNNLDIAVNDLDCDINDQINTSNEFTTFTYNNQVFNVSDLSDGYFIVSQNGTDLKCYNFNVESEDDFKTISNYIKDSKMMEDVIVINFSNDINLNHINNNVLFSNSRFIIINGNGIKIKANTKFHFLTTGFTSFVIINNLTLEGFDEPIINYGQIDLENVNFTNYGSIYSSGNLNCFECGFFNNKGLKSSGIYITNSSSATFTNCTFKNNLLLNETNKDTNFVDIFVDDNSIVNVFTLNDSNHNPNCKYENDGKIIFRNTTEPITRNLTICMKIGHTIEDIANEVWQDKKK